MHSICNLYAVEDPLRAGGPGLEGDCHCGGGGVPWRRAPDYLRVTIGSLFLHRNEATPPQVISWVTEGSLVDSYTLHTARRPEVSRS